jgi:hypothetical protein
MNNITPTMKNIAITLIIVLGFIACITIVKWKKVEPVAQQTQVVSKPKYDRNAMIKVWNTCIDAEKGIDSKTQNFNAQYQKMCNLNTSGCSPSFKEAYLQYLDSWGRMVSYYELEYPKSFLEGVITGAKNSVFHGELDGGSSRYSREIRQYYDTIEAARNRWRVTIDEE